MWLKTVNQLRQPRALKIVIPVFVLLFLLLFVLMFMRGRANRQQNVTPTPDAAVLPVESETAVVVQPEDDPTTQPTMTTPEANEGTVDEVEVLPSAEETETSTIRPSPTETAATPTATELAQTATASPTPEPTNTPSPTVTPTLETTEVACVPSPPFGWERYTIQANDSLSALSEATDTTVQQLMQVNCLDNILLSIGQSIWMPALEPTATPTAEPVPTDSSATAVPPAPDPPGPNPTSPPPTPTVPAPP
jgi:LysM repeat protein